MKFPFVFISSKKNALFLGISIGFFLLIYGFNKYTSDIRKVCLYQKDGKEEVEDLLTGKYSFEDKWSTIRCWINPRHLEVDEYLWGLKKSHPENVYTTSSQIRTSLWSRNYRTTIYPLLINPINSNFILPISLSLQSLFGNVDSSIRRIGDNLHFGVSKDCRQLSILVLKNTFEDAPGNNGDYVTKVLTSNIEFYRYPGDSYKTFSRYVISIDNKGMIDEGWWTSPRNGFNNMYRDSSLSNQTPNFPEPSMQSNSGIVCNLAITTSQDSKNFLGEDVSNIILWATGKDAVLSEDKDGYKVKY
jgi:hypothetical protein